MSYFSVNQDALPGQSAAPRKALAGVLAALALAASGAVLFKLKAETWRAPAPARLSYFEPHAGGCAWYRQAIASGDREQLAVFPTDCARVRVAFPPALDHAVVAFEADFRGEESLDALVFDVDLRQGKPERMPLPEPGEARAFAFDQTGALYAFTLDFEVEVTEADAALTYHGRTFPRSAFPDGTDAVALALVWENGRWTPVASTATRCCADQAPGVEALPLYQRLRDDPQLAWLRREARHVPPETVQKTRLAALPDFPFGSRDPIEVSNFGLYILVAEAGTGMRATVYDRESSQRMLFAPHSAGASFWPDDGPASSP